MKGLTPEQYVSVLQFVQKYHKFALWMSGEDKSQMNKEFPNLSKWKGYGMGIKYIDSCYDSRTGDIWSITFRVHSAYKYSFHTNIFNEFLGKKKPESWIELTFYEIIMKFLKGEMTDKQAKIFFNDKE